MKFHESLFELQSLTALQGYSLQVFASGRIKLTFSDAGTQRYEYYADWPKRDTEAYHRQRKRSFDNLLTILTLWTRCEQRETVVASSASTKKATTIRRQIMHMSL
jgi:hypothetical protein